MSLTGQRLAQGTTLLIMLAWPFLIWYGVTHDELRWLLPLMAILMLGRLLLSSQQRGPLRQIAPAGALIGVLLCLISLLFTQHQWVLWYPVAVNVIMLAAFGGSLWRGMPLVERLARLREPDLSPAGVRYTRRVTQVWCGFFSLNGVMAAATCLVGNMTWWGLWNGMLSYVAMALLMAAEWLVRQRVKKRDA